MKISEIIEIADKKSPGKWILMYSTFDPPFPYAIHTIHNSKCKEIPLAKLSEYGPNAYCTSEDADFLVIAPEMEAKLREIVDITMLPTVIRKLSYLLRDYPDDKETRKLIEKLKAWMEE